MSPDLFDSGVVVGTLRLILINVNYCFGKVSDKKLEQNCFGKFLKIGNKYPLYNWSNLSLEVSFLFSRGLT